MLTAKLKKGSLQRTDNGGPANTWEPCRPGHVASLFFCLFLTVKGPESMVLLF